MSYLCSLSDDEFRHEMKTMSRRTQIEQLLSSNPDDPFLRFAIAMEWQNEGVTENALEAWQWFENHAPDYNGYYYHYASLLISLRRLEEAQSLIKKGMEVTAKQGDRHAWNELNNLLSAIV